jgi:hypothetical protein
MLDGINVCVRVAPNEQVFEDRMAQGFQLGELRKNILSSRSEVEITLV